MAEQTYLIISNRGPRRDGNHGVICERGVAESDLAEREHHWHDVNAPCETYHLRDSDAGSTLAVTEHQAVVLDWTPTPALTVRHATSEDDPDERAAEEARLARIKASLDEQ